MEKKDIIKKFLEKGILLSPEEFKKIDESNYLEIIKKHTGDKKEELSMETEKNTLKNKMTPKDFINYYNKKYSKIRDLLIKKVNAVSINKAKDLTSTSNIIGMVKEKTQNGFLLEDQTGPIEVISRTEPPIGDVIGIIGTSREGKFFEKEMVYPDIPLSHKPNTVDAELVLMKSDAKRKIKTGNIEKDLSNPAHVKIKKGNNELLLLFYEPITPISQEHIVELLRKRHLSPKRSEIRSDEDPFLLDPIPDVVWLIGNEEFVKNYKGVTVVSTGKRDAKINLLTKKVEFI